MKRDARTCMQKDICMALNVPHFLSQALPAKVVANPARDDRIKIHEPIEGNMLKSLKIEG